jgi:DNA invertase Pin-like site-specific DNA recombinase
MSEKIRPHHLARKAVLYVRQSSAAQVTYNQESQRLQYAMKDRLQQLGWASVEVIDDDLGLSAAGTSHRAGFERMVAEVCLGQVGAVAAREVSRFARNSRDWQQLIEVCRMVDTLLIDQEMVYHPRLGNDRLLLGLKGSLNEYELDLLRQRAVEGRNEKVRRGEFLAVVPVGYLKGAGGQPEMDPDQRVRGAIQLVFHKFLELGSARQVLCWLLEEGLELPALRRGAVGWETVWKRPRYGNVVRLLTNPIYAGAYTFGRTETTTRYEGAVPVKSCRPRPRDQWLALLRHHHEGYVTWEQHERIQEMLTANSQQFLPAAPGAAKRGSALLTGMLRCGRCGQKLLVGYSGRAESLVPRYLCQRGNMDNADPKCISFGGVSVDAALGQELLRVLEPAALAAARAAEECQARQQDDVLSALEKEWQAARYAADRAARQFDATDPANRLVADELERRWDAALQRVSDVEQRMEAARRRQAKELPGGIDSLRDVAGDLGAIWNHPDTDVRLKKRLVRALIHEVVVDLDEASREVVLVIHWQGGVHSERRVRRRGRGCCRSAPVEVIDAVRSLARVLSDTLIAGFLNRNDLRTGHGNRWGKERVEYLRKKNQIARHDADVQQAEGWLTLCKAAAELGVSPRTMRLALESGEIAGEHPLSQGPWIVHRRALQTEQARRLVARVGRRRRGGAVPGHEPELFDFSSTEKEGAV